MLVIVDLEATCYGGPEDPKDFVSEIIEIGAVKFDLKKLEIVDRYQAFVRPKINPILTDFCRELTTITQEQVDKAYYFDSVYNNFKKWYGNPKVNMLCSWGYYDKKQIEKDCKRWGIEYSLSVDHWNIKKFYQEMTGQTKAGVGLEKAVNQLGLEFHGVPHRAISDAENTALVLKKVMENR